MTDRQLVISYHLALPLINIDRCSDCWFYCPSFVCLCKSPVPIFPPCSLKLEDGQLVPSCLPTPLVALKPASNGKAESGKGKKSKQDEIVLLKSSLKKGDGSPPKEDAVRRRVQWMDFTGKELAQVREYEPSESGNSCDDGGESRDCFCVIQ